MICTYILHRFGVYNVAVFKKRLHLNGSNDLPPTFYSFNNRLNISPGIAHMCHKTRVTPKCLTKWYDTVKYSLTVIIEFLHDLPLWTYTLSTQLVTHVVSFLNILCGSCVLSHAVKNHTCQLYPYGVVEIFQADITGTFSCKQMKRVFHPPWMCRISFYSWFALTLCTALVFIMLPCSKKYYA